MLLQVLPYGAVLARRNPELGVGALASYLDDVFEMPYPLQVAAVVPAEVFAFPLLDHEDHGLDPARMLEALEADFLSA